MVSTTATTDTDDQEMMRKEVYLELSRLKVAPDNREVAVVNPNTNHLIDCK
jgi:hypothetical protein